MKKMGIWIEVTTLLIPGLNDSDDELRGIAGHLADLFGQRKGALLFAVGQEQLARRMGEVAQPVLRLGQNVLRITPDEMRCIAVGNDHAEVAAVGARRDQPSQSIAGWMRVWTSGGEVSVSKASHIVADFPPI